MVRYARRTDENHADLVRSLRACGYSVLDLSAVGKGCPDLAVSRNGLTWLVEVKRPEGTAERKDGYRRTVKAGELRASQERFRQEWKGRVIVATGLEDVLRGTTEGTR